MRATLSPRNVLDGLFVDRDKREHDVRGGRAARAGQGSEMLHAFPDLGHISAGSLRSQLTTPPSDGDPASFLLFDLVRHAEKALWSYNAARAHHARVLSRREIVNLMGCTDRLEECIDATNCGFEDLKTIVQHQLEAPFRFQDAIKCTLRANKMQRKLLRRLASLLHPQPGTRRLDLLPTLRLMVDPATLHVGEAALSYEELAELVRTLHQVTGALVSPRS